VPVIVRRYATDEEHGILVRRLLAISGGGPRPIELTIVVGFDVRPWRYPPNAAKVTRSALQNAASIAGMVLTTETLMTDLPEKRQAMPAGGGYGGDMDYQTDTPCGWSPGPAFGLPSRPRRGALLRRGVEADVRD
jgi:hypothetical protein